MKLVITKIHNGGFTVSHLAHDLGDFTPDFACSYLSDAVAYIGEKMCPIPQASTASQAGACDPDAPCAVRHPLFPDVPLKPVHGGYPTATAVGHQAPVTAAHDHVVEHARVCVADARAALDMAAISLAKLGR